MKSVSQRKYFAPSDLRLENCLNGVVAVIDWRVWVSAVVQRKSKREINSISRSECS